MFNSINWTLVIISSFVFIIAIGVLVVLRLSSKDRVSEKKLDQDFKKEMALRVQILGKVPSLSVADAEKLVQALKGSGK